MSVRPPHIAIVGAGIGGLAAAACLRRAGIDVLIYEQARGFIRLGAGIQQAPNAIRVLYGLGLKDKLLAQAFQPDSNQSRDHDTGNLTNAFLLGQLIQQRHGVPYFLMHRGDLHAMLTELVPPDSIRLNHKLAGLDHAADGGVRLTFTNGETARADAVIGADGVHSVVRSIMLGDEKPRFTGRVAYRTVFPTALLGGMQPDPCVKWWGPDRHIVSYFVNPRRDELYFVTSTPEPDFDIESWSAKGDLQTLRAAYDTFHPQVQAILAACPDVHKWALVERDPLPRWVDGIVALLGDACHPMTPYMAQGASTSIEDAAILARCLDGVDRDGLHAALLRYEATRKPRTSRIQQTSARNTWLKQPHNADWVYGYDAWTEPLRPDGPSQDRNHLPFDLTFPRSAWPRRTHPCIGWRPLMLGRDRAPVLSDGTAMNDAATDPQPDYRDTVFLPRTGFPMRGDLPKKEPQILAKWEAMDLWGKIRAASAGRPLFILHDGPPYANGHIHIGTALNKILKDVINRTRQMGGYDANYIPGWDCHGLPIEWKIEEEYRAKRLNKDGVPILDFRAECRSYAARWMRIQAAEFRRLGVEGAWRERYATMDLPSEAAIAAEICKFLLNGALYRGLRPVMWSPVEKTVLAEAEIEYHDHVSTTIWVRFPVIRASIPAIRDAAVVIWTTTPWTMPGNRAVAAGATFEYAVVEVGAVADGSLARPGEKLVVAEALLPAFLKDTGITAHTIVQTVKGADLLGTITAHPLRGHGYEQDTPLLLGDFVTTEAGTGFVHIAPSHGVDDFTLGRANGLDVPETVGGDGTYNAWVPLFAGQHVYKAADPVCDALIQTGNLLARGKLTHSYPCSWRSKAPLIFRATAQWFIAMDGASHIRDKALAAIAATTFVPDSGRNRIGSMVAARPDWCISRQRAWGIPIPIFFEKTTGEPLRDPAVVARVIEAFEHEGADAWYSSPPSRFLGSEYDPDAYEQVTDIVDVWFESGCTHAFVLEKRGLPWPADLYLEGSDQHRGWFHTSLLEAVGTRGVAPFKAVLTHGFVNDERGRKMSKSLGNTTAPDEVADKYGIDILRLWVMSSDTTDDLRIGPEILKQQAELYRRLRNTLRWVLGSLDGFSEAELVPVADMPELERWILHRLTEIDARVRAAVQSYDWAGVYPDLHNFCAVDLSAFYFDIRKDAVYCDRPDSPRRRAARTVLDHLHRYLCTWLAPVLCFTAEEAWCARFGDDTSVHLELFQTPPDGWHDPALAAKWDTIRAIRRRITVPIEDARKANAVGSSLQAAVELPVNADHQTLLDEAEWAEIAIVSCVSLVPDTAEPPAKVTPAFGDKCARCWRVLPEVGTNATHPSLCLRCTDAVESGLVCKPA